MWLGEEPPIAVKIEEITLSLFGLNGRISNLRSCEPMLRIAMLRWNNFSLISVKMAGRLAYHRTYDLNAIWCQSLINGDERAVLVVPGGLNIPTLYLPSMEQLTTLVKLSMTDLTTTDMTITIHFGEEK